MKKNIQLITSKINIRKKIYVKLLQSSKRKLKYPGNSLRYICISQQNNKIRNMKIYKLI